MKWHHVPFSIKRKRNITLINQLIKPLTKKPEASIAKVSQKPPPSPKTRADQDPSSRPDAIDAQPHPNAYEHGIEKSWNGNEERPELDMNHRHQVAL